jgi:dUTP pyrophosphatase
MHNILEEDPIALKLSIRQLKVHPTTSIEPKDFHCHFHRQIEPIKIKRAMPIIPELQYEDDDNILTTLTMPMIEKKISTASCHKRLRGLERKLDKAMRAAESTTKESGLLRCAMQIQNDTGATHCLTNNKGILQKFRNLKKPIPINGIEKDNVALTATGMGYLPLVFDDGEVLYVTCLYSEHAEGTILSPTAVAKQYHRFYHAWTIYADVGNNTGYLQFLHHDGLNHAKLPMYCEDGLWFHYIDTDVKEEICPTIRKLSTRSEFKLWHNRMGHPNSTVLCKMHKYARGIPTLKTPDFYKCKSCSYCKIKKDSSTKTRATLSTVPTPVEKFHVGQHLHMDFGFLRGSAFAQKDKEGRTITSIDGFRSYLVIVDRATRYKWLFLTKTKHPPLDEVRTILGKYKRLGETLNCMVRTDQGGELGKSHKFRELIKEFNYTYEPTGSNSSKQNGMAEKPIQDLKRITKCLLHAAGLNSGYWSFAINHAVYIANRTYHSAIKMTPYQAMHNTQPDLSQLKIFGSRCYYKHTKKNQKDLDIAGEVGTFLGYTATMKNVYVQSERTKQIHVSLHKSFDEAHVTAPAEGLPPLAIALQNAGYNNNGTTNEDAQIPITEENLKLKLLSSDATTPSRSTPQSAGLDLHSAVDMVIPPQQTAIIPTDVAIEPTTDTYAQVCSRSSMAIKGITTVGGVIDRDYRGNIKVILRNNSNEIYEVTKKQRIAQMVLQKIWMPQVEVVQELSSTDRNNSGFGSTEKKLNQTFTPRPLLADIPAPTTAAAATMSINDDEYNFDSNPFDNVIVIHIDNTGTHPTRGLDLTINEKMERLQLLACNKGTPAGKIEKWRSTIKNGFLLSVNDIPVTNVTDVKRCITKTADKAPIKLQIGTLDKQAMHPQTGVPQLYFDQINHIGKHLFELRHDPDWMSDELREEAPVIRRMQRATGSIVPKSKRWGAKLTRKKLLKQSDWSDWEASETKQLDQYEKQKMFSEPCPLPPHANVLPFLWTYLVKDDGTKKARCVCNGAPSKGTVTLGPTYAGSLDQTGARIFWSVAAMNNLKVYGADVSNAFAEAPPPVAPLYITIDHQYKQWYEKKGKGKIPDGYVLKVKRALQGHPEAARLWSVLIDKLIKEKLGLTATTHEPCLYSGKYNNSNVLFLRQVDDFAIACKDEKIAKEMIAKINSYMSVQIKYLGLLTRYNGVDVDQRREYIKIYNTTYVDKILNGHKTWLQEKPCHTLPIPMKSEATYIRTLEQAVPPSTPRAQIRLQKEMQLNYRQAIGELIYALVTCRPDISFPLIKLSQYSTNPAREHYEAIKQLFYYLKCTKTEGIYYWRKEHNIDLPPTESSFDTESQDCEAKYQDTPHQLKSATDSDWGGGGATRNNVKK